jgi:hypothetical protein
MRYQQHQQHQHQQYQQQYSELLAENEQLRQRLEEAEKLLASASTGTPGSQRDVGSNEIALPEAVPPASHLSDAVGHSGGGANSDNDARGDSPTVAAFLHPWYERLREDLDELGVEVVDDFKELDADDLEGMASKLKKVQAKKFLKRISTVVAAGGT